MPTIDIVGLDIGGAHLKLATRDRQIRHRAYPLWKDPQGLAAELATLVSEFTPLHVAVTMTGELCDCFTTKEEGVQAICAAVEAACASVRTTPQVHYYTVDGRFTKRPQSREDCWKAAASNWHALATLVAKWSFDNAGLLMDVGSTTTDIIAFAQGQPTTQGLHDTARLLSGELIYTGVVRTPLCGAVSHVPFAGQKCPVAQELFSTTGDAYLVLGHLAESSDAIWTADGRPATLAMARHRLARAICADATIFSEDDARHAAEAVFRAQAAAVAVACNRVMRQQKVVPQVIYVSGQGEFLALDVIKRSGWTCEVIRLSEKLGPQVSLAAPAFAVAELLAQSKV